MQSLRKLLTREHFGLVIRVFAPKPELVPSQCEKALSLAATAAAMRLDNKPTFHRILIMVASDTRRIDHDCGQSAEYLRDTLKDSPYKQISVVECDHEDLYCGILNRASAILLHNRCRYMAVFSSAARGYLDTNFLEEASKAFKAGAAVAGLAIDELQESILEGRIANTACVWDLMHLVSVGGFDQIAEQPYKDGHRGLFTDERQVPWMQGARVDGGDSLYPRAGVEEIIPMIRLVRTLERQCIAPIMPRGGKIWEQPSDPDSRRRHENKMATKRVRQEVMAHHVNADLGVLRDGVMEAYGWRR